MFIDFIKYKVEIKLWRESEDKELTFPPMEVYYESDPFGPSIAEFAMEEIEGYYYKFQKKSIAIRLTRNAEMTTGTYPNDSGSSDIRFPVIMRDNQTTFVKGYFIILHYDASKLQADDYSEFASDFLEDCRRVKEHINYITRPSDTHLTAFRAYLDEYLSTIEDEYWRDCQFHALCVTALKQLDVLVLAMPSPVKLNNLLYLSSKYHGSINKGDPRRSIDACLSLGYMTQGKDKIRITKKGLDFHSILSKKHPKILDQIKLTKRLSALK